MQQLLRCSQGQRIRKSDLADELDVKSPTIQGDMRFFLRHYLVAPNTQKGYLPAPKLNRIMDMLERVAPKKYDFSKSWQEIYPE